MKFQKEAGSKRNFSQQFLSEKMQKTALIEVFGNQRVMLENHKGVVEYAAERICVKVSDGYIKICGQNLFLSQMSSEQLIIQGQIHTISFAKGGL